MFNDFPNLHPLVIHFPIVLLLAAVILALALIFKESYVLKIVTLAVMAAGFLGAVLASYIFHAHPGELSESINSVFERHEKFAGYTVWVSGVTLLLQAVGFFYKLNQRSFKSLVFAASVVSAVFVSLAAHQGARLVYVEGVGPKGVGLVKGHSHSKEENHSSHNMEDMQHSEETNHDSHKDMPGMEGSEHDHMDANHSEHGSEMNHSNMNMERGNSGSGTKEMDHERMNMGGNPSETDMKGMNHGNMKMAQKTNGDMKSMDHDHRNMNKGNQASDMGEMKHGNMNMGSENTMGGMNHGTMTGGLIDTTPPYDNNPAAEEKRAKQKQ